MPAVLDENLSRLADALMSPDGETDYLDVIEALRPYLPPGQFITLCATLEVCPVHVCDFQICVDDDIHGDEVYEQPVG